MEIAINAEKWWMNFGEICAQARIHLIYTDTGKQLNGNGFNSQQNNKNNNF